MAPKKRKFGAFSSTRLHSSVENPSPDNMDAKNSAEVRERLIRATSDIKLNLSFDNSQELPLHIWTKLIEEFSDKQDGFQPSPEQVNAFVDLLEKSDVPVFYEENDKECWDTNLDCALRMLVRAGAKYVTDEKCSAPMHPFVYLFPKILDSVWLKHQNASDDDSPTIGALTINFALYKFRAANGAKAL